MKTTCDLGREGRGITELHTKRLKLRQWRDEDLEPWAQLNADPEVMRHFPATLTRQDSDLLAERCHGQIEEQGWGLWAVEVIGGPEFIGWIGLAPVNFSAHFTPAIEVGWRLARSSWGNGYAPEGARAAVNFGFSQLGLEEIVSFTFEGNMPSRRVMEKLGMTHDPADDFDNPRLIGNPICRHVLFRLQAAGGESHSDDANAARNG
jgi:RimJ/RimL family protein N-acetyltransferase